MSNVFAKLPVYGTPWEVIESRSFSAEEIAAVKKAEIVPSEYGKSVMFVMRSGGKTYIPLSNTCDASCGTTISLKDATLLTLEREGESILRVEV